MPLTSNWPLETKLMKLGAPLFAFRNLKWKIALLKLLKIAALKGLTNLLLFLPLGLLGGSSSSGAVIFSLAQLYIRKISFSLSSFSHFNITLPGTSLVTSQFFKFGC